MDEITKQILESKTLIECMQKIKDKESPVSILGLSDVAIACIVNSAYENTKRQVLLITYNELAAQNLAKHIKAINTNVTYIPKKDIITYEYDAQSMDILHARMEGIINILENTAEITIISAETLITPVLTKKTLQNAVLKIMVANEYNIEEIKQKLVNLGYERQELVEGKGTFSIRGDILDIAISNKKGIRIEFFGDEVDQIRYFDIESQRSTENIKQIKIYPLSEEIEKEPKGTIIEYLPENAIITFDELNKIKIRVKNIVDDNKLLIKDLVERQKQVPYILENMYDINNILKSAEKFQIVNLSSEDISKEYNQAITLEHEEIKKIEEVFIKVTKQEKENRIYKPRIRRSKEFRESEKITFSDLKIGDYIVHRNHGIGQYIRSKYNKSRWYNKRLCKNQIQRRRYIIHPNKLTRKCKKIHWRRRQGSKNKQTRK